MQPELKVDEAGEETAVWPLDYSRTLGSGTRAKGIFLEARAQLPVASRKLLTMKARELILRKPETEADALVAKISKVVADATTMPIIPREIEDILHIKSSERHRWLKDGRLKSAGTRTVKLRGRARQVVFHVFDPKLVEDLLDREVVLEWREQDAATVAESRRRAAWKAQRARLRKANGDAALSAGEQSSEDRPMLDGWEEFEREMMLR